MPSESLFSTMNVIHSKPRNRLLHERVDKLEYISINTRVKAREETEAEITMTEERANQEDRLLLQYNMNRVVEEMIEAERSQELELLAELDE